MTTYPLPPMTEPGEGRVWVRRNPGLHIIEVRNRIEKHNPISGHSWVEYGPVTGYELTGPSGRQQFKKLKNAEKELAELQQFYDKFGFYVSERKEDVREEDVVVEAVKQ